MAVLDGGLEELVGELRELREHVVEPVVVDGLDRAPVEVTGANPTSRKPISSVRCR